MSTLGEPDPNLEPLQSLRLSTLHINRRIFLVIIAVFNCQRFRKYIVISRSDFTIIQVYRMGHNIYSRRGAFLWLKNIKVYKSTIFNVILVYSLSR